MDSGEECATSKILEFTRSQLQSIVPYHTWIHCKDQNWKSVQDPIFSFASINRLELNKTHVAKWIEQAIQFLTLQIQKDKCFACKDVFKDWCVYSFQAQHVFFEKDVLERNTGYIVHGDYLVWQVDRNSVTKSVYL